MNSTHTLTALVDQLDALLSASNRSHDALDLILVQPSRHTAVRSLADSDAVQAFRQALIKEHVDIKVLQQFLALVTTILALVNKRP